MARCGLTDVEEYREGRTSPPDNMRAAKEAQGIQPPPVTKECKKKKAKTRSKEQTSQDKLPGPSTPNLPVISELQASYVAASHPYVPPVPFGTDQVRPENPAKKLDPTVQKTADQRRPSILHPLPHTGSGSNLTQQPLRAPTAPPITFIEQRLALIEKDTASMRLVLDNLDDRVENAVVRAINRMRLDDTVESTVVRALGKGKLST